MALEGDSCQQWDVKWVNGDEVPKCQITELLLEHNCDPNSSNHLYNLNINQPSDVLQGTTPIVRRNFAMQMSKIDK